MGRDQLVGRVAELLRDRNAIDADLAQIGEQPWDEEFHAKLLQVADMHLAAAAYL